MKSYYSYIICSMVILVLFAFGLRASSQVQTLNTPDSMSFKRFQKLIDTLSLTMDSYEKMENPDKIVFVRAYNTIVSISDSSLISKSFKDFQSQFDHLLKMSIWAHKEQYQVSSMDIYFRVLKMNLLSKYLYLTGRYQARDLFIIDYNE